MIRPFSVAAFAGLCAATATLLLPAICPRALAVENRVNLQVEVGPLLNLGQPALLPETTNSVTGLHLRVAAEYLFHERLSIELAYDPNLVFNVHSGLVDAQQNILAGARSRLWYSPSNSFLLPGNRQRKLTAADYFSDVSFDFHLGVSIADRVRLYYDVGLAVRMPIARPLQIGAFVRFAQLLTQRNDENTYKQLMFGLSFSIGFAPVHAPPDSDRDGVTDDIDRCPNTPSGALVNEFGCEIRESPSKIAPAETKNCADTDLDGVCDGEDNCDDTPLGTPVDAHGCPLNAPTTPPPAPAEPAPKTGPAEPAP